MARRTPFALVLEVVAWLTVLSGSVQVVAPGFVLRLLGASDDGTARQLFATVGMFMVVAGGLLVTTLRRPRPDPDVVVWSAVQKLGASVAVGVAVANSVFDPVALGVATLDLLTSVLLLVFLRTQARERGARP
ncbi:hypothetical protein [Cellulomonas sp. URHD0024]|uniref:hypothetical protein n=1 Tax=Cellulomonas sp. URHD0024 TaxID=1302620 RepID=UPI00041BDCE6|nr:hypothetical protein [Cellulomonas sp. URHD0024]